MEKIIKNLQEASEAIEEFDPDHKDTDLFMTLCEIETMIKDLKDKQ